MSRTTERVGFLVVSSVALALVACVAPKQARPQAEKAHSESEVPPCPLCNASFGRLKEVKATPPAEGQERLHALLSKLEPTRAQRGLGLALIVGSSDQLSATGGLKSVVRVQRDRLDGFVAAIRKGALGDDELRKQLLALALCVCPGERRCQGGAKACVRCSPCTTMAEFHPGAKTRGPKGWPRARSGTAPRMGLMSEDCPPKNVCLVIDVSGSMQEDRKLERVKAAVKESLRHYMAGDVFSLVAFNEKAWVVVPPTQLEASGDMKGLGTSKMPRLMSSKLPVEKLVTGRTAMERTILRFLRAIDGLIPMGRTNAEKALMLAGRSLDVLPAQRRLLRDPRAINRILLFSDGMHNAERAVPKVLARFHALGHRLVSKRVSISTFGVGRVGFDERLLSELVRPGLEHSGRFYYVRNLGRVRELLWDDLMTTPMLKDAALTVDLPNGLEVVGPKPFTVHRGSRTQLRLNLGTIAAEQKRALALRLRRSGRGDAGEGEVRIRLVYTDPRGRRRAESTTLRVSKALGPRHAKAQLALEELVIQDVRSALGRAVDLLDRGDRKAASRELRAARDRLPQTRSAR